MKIRAIQFTDDEIIEIKDPSVDEVVALTTSWAFCWIDLDISGARESDVTELLVDKLGFHALTAEDCFVQQTYTPKVDDYEDYQFYIFHYFVIDENGQVVARELNVYVGRNFVITVHRTELKEFRHQLTPFPDYLTTTSEKTTLFLHHILDVIIDAYISELNHVQKLSDRIEEMILAGRSTRIRSEARVLVRNMLTLRQSLTVMRRSVQAERVIIGGLIRAQRPEEEEEEAEAVRYLNDLLDHLDRAIEILGHERDALADLMDLHITLASDRTNEIIRILTVISAIILPLNLIAGIYGMNFQYMPELTKPWAYPTVWAVMILLAGGLLYLFRKRGWI
ncbi:magnesium/cobalt transporter CorA [bacterium]|nr:magnesium/cobalt transporter CorA [bacterium]